MPLVRVTLPEIGEVFGLSEAELPVVWEQVQGYLQHGIDLAEDEVVLDVGANVGLFALHLYRRFGDTIEVHAFEPLPPIFEALEKNLAQRDAKRIFARPLGLSSESGTRTFTFYPGLSVMSTCYPQPLADDLARLRIALDAEGELRWRLMTKPYLERALDGQPHTCRMTTVSEYLAEAKIDAVGLLKIDVERSELDVVEGVAPEDWPKIRQVVVEVHDDPGRLEAIEAKLTAAGLHLVARAQDAQTRAMGVVTVYAVR